jgi:hypothetical protein
MMSHQGPLFFGTTDAEGLITAASGNDDDITPTNIPIPLHRQQLFNMVIVLSHYPGLH